MADPTSPTRSQPPGQDLNTLARVIIESNFYLTLGTANVRGEPWVSPVYYAVSGYKTFYWVSSPEARHSRNLVANPHVSIVIFDSQVAIGAAQAVYMSAIAEEQTGADLEQGIAIYSARSLAHGAKEWSLDDVQSPAVYRLYRATVSEQWVLDAGSSPDRRAPVSL